MKNALKPWRGSIIVLVFTGAALACLWLYTRNAKINFLPPDHRAEWILFPKAPEAGIHPTSNLDVVFRRALTLTDRPQIAQLRIRAARRIVLRINGRDVDLSHRKNWKNIESVDVVEYLQPGINTVEARVFNEDGPPALWFLLEADQQRWRSDSAWEASFSGSSWRHAMLAARPRFPGPGNTMSGRETVSMAVAKIWPLWLLFLLIAIALWLVGYFWLNKIWRQKPRDANTGEIPSRHFVVLLVAFATIWIVLLANNNRFLRHPCGFDVQAHLDYVRYVQERRALPLPNEGFEMFQPPLFYLSCALLLSSCGLTVDDTTGILLLRGLTTLFGVAQFVLVFLSLRLLFRRKSGAQLVGLGLAAFLPMQLYLSHYTTNETLAALLSTTTIYFALRVLVKDDASPWECAWLGLLLGAALLAKVTAMLLIPPLVLTLAAKWWRKKRATIWIKNFGVISVACFAICGWHYIRIWHYSGTPVVTNWDWWQDAGYRTVADYFRFGRSLTHPFFSSFAGFWDGIYSTLWGDGLCGGEDAISYRPPWNYSLMAGGYLLALIPTLLILMGAAVGLYRYLRQPSASYFLLLASCAAIVMGLVLMTMRVASHATVKAFYGFAALVPLCFFCGLGWEAVTRGRKPREFVVGVLLILWSLNSLSAVWVRHSVAQQVCAGLKFQFEKKIDNAISEGVAAIRNDPLNATARRFLAQVLDESGRSSEALEQAEQAVKLAPEDSDCFLELGALLLKRGDGEQATNIARRAIELGPENLRARQLLLLCLFNLNHYQEAVDSTKDALTMSPFNPQLHFASAQASMATEDFTLATKQFGYALLLRPGWEQARLKFREALFSLATTSDAPRQLQEVASSAPDSPVVLNDLAWLLATNTDSTLRNGARAVQLAERAAAMNVRQNATFLNTLAAAYAETGRFSEAIASAERALALAELANSGTAAALSQTLLKSFRANQPYHVEPTWF